MSGSRMNQLPPPDNVFNFPAASPHFYSTCDAPAVTEQQLQAAGTRTREGGRGRGAEGHATIWSTMHLFYLEDSAGYRVDGSLGHEGADLFSSPGQAPGFSEPPHCRKKLRRKANKIHFNKSILLSFCLFFILIKFYSKLETMAC